jgi:hypothetical protein
VHGNFLFIFSYIIFNIRNFQKILDSCLGTSDINELKQSWTGLKMREVAVLFAVLVSLMLVVPCFASMPIVTDGLVGCWGFDEGSLVTALDMSGNGNNGTMMKTEYSDPPPGTFSTASLNFNNTQGGNAYSYVIIPDSPSLRPNSSLTLAAWVKTSVVQSRPAAIIGKQYGLPLYDSYCLWYEWGNLNFYLRTETNQKYISIAQPPMNEWHYVVGTYDGSFMRLYVDGVERVNGTFSGSLVYDNNPLSIGADSDRADHTLEQGWDGCIDEVLIYNRALNPAEIMQIIHPATTLYGIIGNHLVTIDQTTGNATEVGIINTSGATAMTYDPYRDVLYCLANSTTDPKLITIDRTTAETALVGPIELAGHDPGFLTFVESLAFNPADRFLYGTAGTYPISSMLLRIDPATGNATQIASISGTTENDGDSLVFINDTLYVVDSPDSVLFTVNLSTGAAIYIGDIGYNNAKLAYNPETQTLFGAPSLERLLIEISPTTGQGAEIGQTHTPEEFEGTYLHTMAVVFDRRPPDIDKPIQDPPADNVEASQNVTISVNVTDNLSGVKHVRLVYSFNSGTTWEEPLIMNHDATTGSYEAVIPSQPTGTWVNYKIVAYDQTGNNATLEGTQHNLVYQVIPEFASILILPLLVIATLIAVIVCRRKRAT